MFASGPSNQSFTFTFDGRTLIAFDHCFVIVPYVRTFQSRTPRKDYGMGWLQLLKYACCSLGDAEIARPDNTRLDNAAQGSGVREQGSAGRLIAAE